MDLNAETALSRLGGNNKLYCKILDRFVKDNAAAGEESAKLIAAGDMESLERFAHTIKGLAGTVGSDGLYQSALALEHAAKDRADQTRLGAAQAAFQRDATATVAAVQDYLTRNAQ